MCVNSSWKRLVQEGEMINTTDHGSPRNPPTLSAAPCTEEIDLQSLVDGWTNYLSMQTTFTTCGRLACLPIDRYELSDSGQLEKRNWKLEVNARVWLPFQSENELGYVHQPFIVVAAVAHQGQDEAGRTFSARLAPVQGPP